MKSNRNTVILCGSALALIGGCSFFGSAGSTTDEGQVVFICSETKQLILRAAEPTPALNPETGSKTLLRALYCPQCDEWQPVPPVELYRGNPLGYHCPRHRCPMSSEGPFDDSSSIP